MIMMMRYLPPRPRYETPDGHPACVGGVYACCLMRHAVEEKAMTGISFAVFSFFG